MIATDAPFMGTITNGTDGFEFEGTYPSKTLLTNLTGECTVTVNTNENVKFNLPIYNFTLPDVDLIH